MTYQETIDFLFKMLPMYQKEGKTAFKKDLSNTLALLKILDNPHQKIKTIHIAGTNGKGSSAHAIAGILQAANYKTGLYTSPHLKSFSERIKINGNEILENEVVDFVALIKPHLSKIQPSFFEVTVAMSFYHFAKHQVDIAVIETGLGGRLDSTNVISPEICLITNIGLDHTHILGDTRAKIAFEKGGIIKENMPVIIGEMDDEIRPVFEKISEDKNAELIIAKDFKYNQFDILTPNYFKKNINGVLTVIEKLKQMNWNISDDEIYQGISSFTAITGFKGRFQIIDNQILTIVDVSHNAEGLAILFEQIKQLNKGKLHLIYGAVNDKDISKILDLLPKDAAYYWTQSSVPRSLKVEELAKLAQIKGLVGESAQNVNEAIQLARKNAQSSDTILVTGSTFVVAEIENL